MENQTRYACHAVALSAIPQADDSVWDTAPRAELSDTVSGETPFLATEVRILRDDAARKLYVRFIGEDDEVHSDFRLHDEAVYRQDVLEIFLCDAGDRIHYKELECTPYDVHFDGTIENHGDGQLRLNMDWDVPGWQSKTRVHANNRIQAVWALPYEGFAQAPRDGEAWPFNAYRIDHHSQRGLSLQAWQPTMKDTFHVPERFGLLEFVP